MNKVNIKKKNAINTAHIRCPILFYLKKVANS